MRSEKEMLNLIMNTAKNDDRIRAVIMNGSRVNPAVEKDIFQDFDIVYLVTDLAPFINNLTWIKRFGELMILQLPDMMGEQTENKGIFSYLMQFKDGNRIDLKIVPLTKISELYKDSLSVILLDKDNILKPFPAPNEDSYLPKKPTVKEYEDCCNEFWWVCTYVAKGLWRAQIIYAKSMFEQVLREELMKMLNWRIGIDFDFQKNPGLFGKNLKKYLNHDQWEMLLDTYSDASIEDTWQSLFIICRLFRITAKFVADHFGYNYPNEDDQQVSSFLMHVKDLPKTAKDIY